jgi:GH35 family endo-1,4-beta-xylanase
MVPITLLFLVIYAVGNTDANQTLGRIDPNLYFGSATANTTAQLLDVNYQKILATEFAAVALMDGFIWSKTEPSQGVFNFSAGDNLVEFASLNNQGILGHSLVQTSPSEYTLCENAD